MHASSFAAAVALLAASALAAQTGGMVGTVARDSAGHAVGGAEIRFPELNKGANTNYMGEFRVDGLSPGKHLVSVRSLGFRPYIDSVDIVAGRIVERDFVLIEAPATLDTVRTSAAHKFRSPMLNAVEERRQSHQGGQFLTDSALRQMDNEKLVDVLNRVGGMITFQKGPGAFVASGRSFGDGGPALARDPKPGVATPCYVTLFIDGIKRYQGPPGPANPPPDFSMYGVNQFAAVEYYAGGASLPAQFNATGSSCGTLLLWTREK